MIITHIADKNRVVDTFSELNSFDAIPTKIIRPSFKRCLFYFVNNYQVVLNGDWNYFLIYHNKQVSTIVIVDGQYHYIPANLEYTIDASSFKEHIHQLSKYNLSSYEYYKELIAIHDIDSFISLGYNSTDNITFTQSELLPFYSPICPNTPYLDITQEMISDDCKFNIYKTTTGKYSFDIYYTDPKTNVTTRYNKLSSVMSYNQAYYNAILSINKKDFLWEL